MKTSTIVLLGAGSVLAGLMLATKKAVAMSTQGAGTINWWTDQNFIDFANMAQRLKMNPADPLIVLYSESALSPTAVNRGSDGRPIAIGLNQLVLSTAKGLGLTQAQWEALPSLGKTPENVTRQLVLVERYFKSLAWVAKGNTFKSAAQVYEANFAPAYLSRGSDPAIVLYRKGIDGKAYDLNKGFDVDHKGTITLGDLGKAVQRNAHGATFLAALARLRTVINEPDLSPVFY